MDKKRILLIFIVTIFTCTLSFPQSNETLWYDRPAEHFEGALVLGNGKTSATVFGGIQSDRIYLNDATLWSGGPVDPNANPDVSSLVPQVREALAREDYRAAERLNRRIEGKFSESFSPLGTLTIDHKLQGDATNYYRELDISKAVAKVRYDLDGVTYTREYFVSNPDKIMVIKLSASKKESLNFSVKFESLLKYTTSAKDNMLQAHGYAPYFAYPDYMGRRVRDPIRFDENKGTRFSTDIKVKNEGGQVTVSDTSINVNNANEVAGRQKNTGNQR